MTDLKNLLEEAAGDEPVITDADLAADLHRGQRSARWRQFGAVVAGVAVTALVITGGWTVLSDTKPSGMPVESGVAASPSGTPSAKRPTERPTHVLPPEERLPPAPTPAHPVELEPDGKVRKGTNLVCDLKPKGWRAVVWSGREPQWSTMNYVHPTLHKSGKFHPATTEISVQNRPTIPGPNGEKWLDKYGKTWEQLARQQMRAGNRKAVVAGEALFERKNGRGEFHMRMTETRYIVVSNSAWALGWDRATVLRFVGSCHYK